jgi:hypothetical protein
MRRSINKIRKTIRNAAISSQVDAHKWATKMEVCRVLSGKRDLEIKPVEKQTH